MVFNIKKRFFKKMLRKTEAEIWDIEFNRFTAVYERESYRQKLDLANDMIHKIEAQEPVDKAKLETAQKEAERLTVYLKEFDAILSGEEATEENPNGRVGLDQRLENLMKRKGNIVAFIKHYC